MWFLRSSQTKKDRECGLIFAWRLPVGDGWRWLMAAAVVLIFAALLAVTVKVRVTAPVRMPERRASLILVPSQGEEWKALRLMAMQAGPFPVKSDWSKEAVVKEVERRVEDVVRPRGWVYEPEWSELEEITEDRRVAAVVLPDLPTLDMPEGPVERKSLVLKPAILSGRGRLVVEGLAPQSDLRGVRVALQYEGTGRVMRVTLWSPLSAKEGEPLEQWLLGARVEEGEPGGGWLVIEVSP